MKVAKSLLLGAAAGLATVVSAQAADLPTRKAAPVQYVKICDAYGAGFFYIPGTDTCLRVGGLVLAQMRIQGSAQMYALGHSYGGAAWGTGPTTQGFAPTYTSYRTANGLGRDSIGYDAAANLELDARTQTGWGTLRTFIRLSSVFGTGLNATTGSYAGLLAASTAGWNGVTATVGKEFTYLNKAFIQFAGITMGRVQSFFDFYTDQYTYEPLRGSNQNVWALAYTATFGGGFSATLSIEDTQSHRGAVGNVLNTNVAAVVGPPAVPAIPGVLNLGGAVGATPTAGRLPDIIANLRVDQAWGSAQLAAALHPVRAALYWSGLNPGAPLSVSNQLGYALSAGVQFKLDSISPGDQLWLQAIYAKGAVGYTSGTNMAFTGSPNLTQNYGMGVHRISNAYGWNLGSDFDCVYTLSGKCDLSTSWAVTGAFKHFWSPTVSSTLFGSYYAVNYSGNATTPVSLNGVAGGVSNYKEIRLGTNLEWSPVRGFVIGGEIHWMRGITTRPFGLTSDLNLALAGLPTFKGVNDSFYGKIRMLRAF